MLPIRKLLVAVLPAVLSLSVCASFAHAQETNADAAKKLLQKGLDEFKAKDYMGARKDLGSLKDPKLAPTVAQADMDQVDKILAGINDAVTEQAAARDKLTAAKTAREGNKLAEAEKLLAAAATSEYLPDAERKTAQEDLAAVRQALAAAPKAAPADTPPAAGETPPPAPAAETAAPIVAEEQADDILDVISRQRAVQKHKAEFDMNEAFKRANEVLAKAGSAADFDAASSAVSVGENVLTNAKTLFTPNEVRQKQDQIDQLRTFIQTKRGVWERAEVAKTRIEIENAERRRIEDAQGNIRRQVFKYSADVQAAIRRKEYTVALDLMDKILKIDPDNQSIKEQKYILQQVELMHRENGYAKEEHYQRQQVLIDIREAEIPWYELLRYPKDWREITARREPYMSAGGNESEQNRQTMAKLKRKIATVSFDNTEFKAVVEWLQQVANLNIQVKWAVLETAGVTPTTVVKSVHLTDVSVEKALTTVLDDISGGTTTLSYVVDEGVLTISTKDDLSSLRYRRTLVYDISDLLVTVPDFAGPRMSLNMSTGNGQSGGGSSDSGGIFGGSGDSGSGQNVNLINRTEIVNQLTRLIARTVDKDSWMDPYGTGTVGSMSEMGGQLVITQTAENHRAVLGLINQLRESKALQITIECRFLSVNTGFLNTIGIDLQTFLNIGAKIVQTSPGGPGVPAGIGTFVTPGQGTNWPNLTPIAIAQQGMAWATGSTTTPLSAPISGGIGSIGTSATVPAIQVFGTFLDDIQVDFLIQATQANSMARSMTAPRLTIYNGQSAYVTFATQQAYVSNVDPIVAENAVAYRATVAFIPTGTVLQVQGTVSADRRYVMMTVQPQIAQLNGFTTYFTSVISSDANGRPLSGIGQIQLPNVTVQDLSTTVSVPDGGTLLLGGQKASGELEREEGAPILSKIPVIRRLFTNEGKVRDEQTILILIKPKIIIHREEEQRFFPGMESGG